MAVHGFITHAAANRRRLWWLIASYVVAFELICAFALIVLLAIHDPGNTIITNPAGYALRYAVPVALLAYLLFRLFYYGHLKHVRKRLNVRMVEPGAATSVSDKRFLRIADQICITSGVRRPVFGIIDAAEPNALAVGASRDGGLIAVTQGLLDQLDDEELAAVITHEAAHIRNGDTQIMAANHALMRTSVNMQVNNPLRVESWQQMLLVVMLPFFLPLLLAGGAATMLAMRLSFQARRGIALSRDFIADGEAVRVTQFPDALVSALRKVERSGAFAGSEHFGQLLFCGSDGHGSARQPTVSERIETIEGLSGAMMDKNRIRRDTRETVVQPATIIARPAQRLRRSDTPPPPMPTFMQIVARPGSWAEWHEQCVDYWQWREDDERNFMGLTAKSYIPLAVTLVFMAIFHWPTHGTFLGAIQIFNPANLVAGYETADGGLNFFKYAGEEAALKQGYLTAIVAIFFIVASATPGLREKVYPHVDWERKKRPTNFWSQVMESRNDKPEAAERESVWIEPRTPKRPAISDSLRRFGERVEIAGLPVGASGPWAMQAGTSRSDAAPSAKPTPHQREEPSLKGQVADFALGEAVDHLTGGWVTLNDEDDHEPRRQPEKRESFNDRLERELAKLSGQPVDSPSASARPQSFNDRLEAELAKLASQAPEQAPPATPVVAQPSFRPIQWQGFGRKIA